MSGFETLLSPYELTDKVILRNRLISGSGQQALTQGPEPFPTDTTFDDIIAVAAAGASIVTFTHYGIYGGGAAMGDQSRMPFEMEQAHFMNYDYDKPKIWNLLTQYSTLVHMYGSKAIVRIGASRLVWPKGKSYLGGDKSMYKIPEDYLWKFGKRMTFAARNPSAVSSDWRDKCVSKEEIRKVQDELVDLCKKYKSSGFDGISFRADRFLDKDTNIREDEYGGEIENRGRFFLELFSMIKEQVGEDFLIEVNLMADSDHGHDGELPHGYTLEECIRFLKMIEPYIDYVQLRERLNTGYQCLSYNSKPGVHPVLEHAKALKDAGFKKGVAVNGGFTIPEDMEAALNSGTCDMIATARSFLADPLFIKKITSDIRPTPCLRCNKCHHHIHDLWITGCSVNPKASLTHRLLGTVKPSLKKKKVAVIGGGPIGMRTACFAAENGHDVTLFEKTGYLGGKLKHGDLYESKWTIKEYRLWLIEEMDRLGVKVQMNCEPSPEDIKNAGFDTVIACTGSVAKRPPVEGADDPKVWTAEDVYEQRAELGQKVVIVGGAEVATDTAIHLAQIGKDVVVVTREDTMMKREQRAGGLHMVHELHFPDLGFGTLAPVWAIYDNLNPVFEATTIKVTPTSVTYVKDGNEVTVDCDSVIVTGGYAPCTESAMKYGRAAGEFYVAGDVQADLPGNLQQGNITAYGIANIL